MARRGTAKDSGSGSGGSKRQTHRCPLCRKEFSFADRAEVPSFPFCSEACKVQDLGAWFGGDYQIHSSLITGEDTGGHDDDFTPPDESDG